MSVFAGFCWKWMEQADLMCLNDKRLWGYLGMRYRSLFNPFHGPVENVIWMGLFKMGFLVVIRWIPSTDV
jgi:hypothetical protein